MRLSSTDIRYFLDEGLLKIIGDSQHPFSPKEQIRPGSVDIRISNIFWKFNKKNIEQLDIIDLHQAKAILNNPELMYLKIELSDGEHLEIQPGEIVLTETLEKIEMPHCLSGALKGRSSFARLGISIHCTGDYINPGYQGYMPLQIINHTPIPVKLYSYLSLAQLVFYFLYSRPDINYQSLPDTIYNSKRCNTEGLSLWFRDKEIEKLSTRISGGKFNKHTEDKLQLLISQSEKRLIKQIESEFQRKNIKKPEQIEKALESYENKDIRRDKKMRFVFWVITLVTGALLSVFIPELIKVISNGDTQNPEFWVYLISLAFCIFILWITFDYKYIGF
ncbi:MAG: dCTP deaminase [Moorea sp. SIOASIH]|uniref:dCTP deaminase n=1 Tax=Moorena sp. SIOASIH TaxID=2607817 RepID=UPI0013B60374|nr:dCTP deaminase [Moorena sp. SIOASIH]NEO39589.1 dCTP deaminase [Moorena sp. SIOASIH]